VADEKEEPTPAAVIVTLSLDNTLSVYSASIERHMESTRVKRFKTIEDAKAFFKQFEGKVFSDFE
jgi:hypothetical protein